MEEGEQRGCRRAEGDVDIGRRHWPAVARRGHLHLQGKSAHATQGRNAACPRGPGHPPSRGQWLSLTPLALR